MTSSDCYVRLRRTRNDRMECTLLNIYNKSQQVAIFISWVYNIKKGGRDGKEEGKEEKGREEKSSKEESKEKKKIEVTSIG